MASLGTCQNCAATNAPGVEWSRCGRCRGVAYCSRLCQLANWKDHKPSCTWRLQSRAQGEANALIAPSLAPLDEALKHLARSTSAETVTALANALAIHDPTPLHTTHALFISAVWDPSIPDPVSSWTIRFAQALPHAVLGGLIDEFGKSPQMYTDGDRTFPLRETWTQEGLSKYHGFGGFDPKDFKTMAVWLGSGKEGGVSAIRFMPNGINNLSREEMGEKVWAARHDGDWVDSLKKRIKLGKKERAKAEYDYFLPANYVERQFR